MSGFKPGDLVRGLDGVEYRIEGSAGSQGRGKGKAYLVTPVAGGKARKLRATTLTLVAERVDTLDDVVDDAARRDRERENRAELKKITLAESRQRRIEALLRECVAAYDATPLVRPPVGGKLPEHEDILVTSDWHIGQQVTMEETGGIYEQTMETTRNQVAKIWRAVEHLHAIDQSGRKVNKLHHLFLGDLVENDVMRASQSRKIEDVVSVQAVQGIDLLAWLIRQELQIYPEVEVELVGGNHDRFSQRPGDAGLGELSYVDTWSWVAGAMIERLLASDIASGRLKVRNWTTYFGYKKVSGLKAVWEHGSSFKWSIGAYGGVPFYAVSQLGPRYAQMLGGADLIMIGHGHQPINMPIGGGRGWIVANGALPATSTYIQAGKKVVSRPMQWKISTHVEHGITGFVPIYCDVPGQLPPGALWEDPDKYAALASGKTPPDAI